MSRQSLVIHHDFRLALFQGRPRMSGSLSALVLGVGNILWADEGYGVRCVEAFAQRFCEHSRSADRGRWWYPGPLPGGPVLREHNPVVIFDAVDFGDAPGSLRLVYDDDIPAFVGAHKMSLHQAGLQDVIACAKLLGGCAPDMLLVGVQPVELEDYGGSLRPAVRARIPRALELASSYLAGHGIELSRADAEPSDVITPGLELGNYECGRPSAQSACRAGDERVLARTPKP